MDVRGGWVTATGLSVLLLMLVAVSACDKDGGGDARSSTRPTFETTSDEPVLLRYQYEVGEQDTIRLTADVTVHTSTEGEAMDMTMAMDTVAELVIRSVAENGDATAVLTFTRISTATVAEPLVNQSYDSRSPGAGSPELRPLGAMLDVPIEVVVSARGELIESNFYPLIASLQQAGLADTTSIDQVTTQLLQTTFVQLPEDPVQAGDIYEAGAFTLAGPGAQRLTASVQYEVLQVSGDQARVLLRPIAELDFGTEMMPGAEIETTEIDGWILFDRELGTIAESEMGVELSMSLSVMGQSGDMEMSMTARFEVTDRQSGVVAPTVAEIDEAAVQGGGQRPLSSAEIEAVVAEVLAEWNDEQYRRYSGSNTPPPEPVWAPETSLETPAVGDSPSEGPDDAPIQILLFQDYECPYSANLQPIIQRIRDDYGEQVHIVYRSFPLRPNANLSAQAALAAAAQGRFREMHDLLFENGQSLDRVVIDQLAEQLGLDVEAFGRALDQEIYRSQVTGEFEDAMSSGIRATPSVVVNDELLPNPMTYDVISTAIQRYLE